LAELLQETHDFRSIDQEGKGTCAATVCRGMLIDHDAAEYVRIQRGLASPQGVALLRDDRGVVGGDPRKKLIRKRDWQADDSSGYAFRSTAARLQDPAAMQFAYGDHGQRYVYSNRKDAKLLASKPSKELGGGLENDELRHLLKGYFPASHWELQS